MTSQDDSIRLKAVNHLTYNVTDKVRATKFWNDILGVKQIPSQVDAEHIAQHRSGQRKIVYIQAHCSRVDMAHADVAAISHFSHSYIVPRGHEIFR